MKKRPFILVELMIAIAILSLCAIPLMGYPYFSYRRERKLLLEIELQRQAEILFFDLLKDLPCTWEELEFNTRKETKLNLIKLEVEGLGSIKIHPHYRLYVHPNAKDTKINQGIAKVWCTFCLDESKDSCEKKNSYTFNFLAVRVGKK